MRFDPQANVTKLTAADTSKRKAPRLKQEYMECNLGRVLDVSAGGIQVLTSGKPPARVMISFARQPWVGTIKAELVWSKRVGLFKRHAGYRFEEVSEATGRMLVALALSHRQLNAG